MNIILSGILVSLFNIKRIEDRVLNNILANFYTRKEIFTSWILANFLLMASLSLFTILSDFFILFPEEMDIEKLLSFVLIILIVSILYLLFLELVGFITRNSLITILTAFIIIQLLTRLPPSWRYFSMASIGDVITKILVSSSNSHAIYDLAIMIFIYIILSVASFIILVYIFIHKGEYD
jgi:hypothetical protein